LLINVLQVDTHVHRLAKRWHLTSDSSSPEQAAEDLRRRFPRSFWNQLHLQFIYFGREHCPAKGHLPERCPICCWTSQKSLDGTEEKVVASVKKKANKKTVSATRANKMAPLNEAPAKEVANERLEAPESPHRASCDISLESPATNSPKKHKGIIFYSERQSELSESPGLVIPNMGKSPIANNKQPN